MSLVELILNAGSIAGLVTILLEVHQSRRNRSSCTDTFEGTHSSREPYQRDGFDYTDYHFEGIIRNASVQANSIVRIYLAVWKNGDVTQTLRFGHGEKSITDRATREPLVLPLHMEARSAKRVEVIFEIRLTEHEGQLSRDGQLATEMVPLPGSSGRLLTHKHSFELVFEDAAGNYFDKTGRLLSRELIDLNWTLVNYKGWKRIRRKGTIAWAWIRWKLAILRSYFGFYK
jgi:hypothetical protein